MEQAEVSECSRYKSICEVRFLLSMAWQNESPTERKKITEKAMIELDKYIYDNFPHYRT